MHLLEEVWCIEPEDKFHKIFKKIATRGINAVIELSKEDLESLTWKEENGDLPSLIKSEVGAIRNLMHHIAHMKKEGEFTSE